MASGGSSKMMEFTAEPKSDYCTTRMATMWQHQQNGLFTDFTIKVKDKSIPCHKVVMSASSEYFTTALTSEFKEKQEGQICMEDMDADVMGNIVRYLYGQTATFNIDSLVKMVDAIELLQLKDLKEQLEEFMSSNFTADHVLSWWKLASKYSMEDVRVKSIKLMSSDITLVSASEDFKQLNIEELLKLIMDDDFELHSRDKLLLGCIEWVDFEPLARKDKMIDILKNVNLERCSLETLKTIDKKYQDLLHDVNVYRIILDAIFKKKLIEVEDGNKKNEKCFVVLGGMSKKWNGGINRKCFVGRNLDPSEWEEFAEIPNGLQFKRSPIVCTNDGFIVLCGGGNNKKITKYDAKNKTWNDLPDSPVGLVDASAVTCNNSVYLLGGSRQQNSVYRLDLSSLTWHQEANMLEKQHWPIAGCLGNAIYVVYNNDTNPGKKPCSLQVFTAQTTKSWEFKSSLPNNCPSTGGASISSTDDSLYLVGGQAGIAAHYSVPRNTWTLLKSHETFHTYGSSVLYDGNIYVVGHENSDHSDASVYNIEEEKWSTLPLNLPFKQISFFKLAVVSWI